MKMQLLSISLQNHPLTLGKIKIYQPNISKNLGMCGIELKNEYCDLVNTANDIFLPFGSLSLFWGVFLVMADVKIKYGNTPNIKPDLQITA